MQNTEHFYVMSQLVQFTGLTDRTLRNHLASGILQGEKCNGMWRFTPEQVETFLAHPAVRPGILARNHSLVYDFLMDTKKPCQQTCMILDIPSGNAEDISAFFCNRINEGGDNSLRFSFHMQAPHSRVILTGPCTAVLALVNEYYAAYPQA